MKVRTLPLVIALTTAFQTAEARPRSSVDFAVATDGIDAGGRRNVSAAYTNDGSIGAVMGVSAAAAETTVKSGYAGQLYDVAALTLSAPQPTVNERATIQLGAFQLLDDSSYLSIAANSVAWSVAGGPVTGISADGIATAGTVYHDTGAIVQGAFDGQSATLNLTVLNVTADDFGIYANDGLPDDWQAQYFGFDNPQAAPDVDADGTGFTNLFKYVAGLNPINPSSRFTLTVSPIPGQPAQAQVIFSPRFADRTYQVMFKDDLSAPTWTLLTGGAVTDAGERRTVTDTTATGASRFYRIQIIKP